MDIAVRLIPMLVILVVAGCAAGPEGPYNAENPAGFFPGLWHGFIAWITFILSLFTSVKMYAVNNTGPLYDLGFLIGVGAWLGGGTGSWCKKSKRRKSRREQEWREVAEQVEAKIKREMRKWAETEEGDDWPEVEKKLEEKIKNKLKEWADS